MEISKDMLKTETNITGEQLYSAIDTLEELYQSKRTVALKTAKEREVLSSKFMLKNNSLVMVVSYCPKPNRNVLLVPTEHSKLDLCEALHKKSVIIDFYNSQRCGVDIVNQMLRDYSCQLTCDSWVVVVFRTILCLYFNLKKITSNFYQP